MSDDDSENADKRLPVTPSARDRLRGMKRGGESFSELLMRLADFYDPDDRDVSAVNVESVASALERHPSTGPLSVDYDSGRVQAWVNDGPVPDGEPSMTGQQFRAALDLAMASDPFPIAEPLEDKYKSLLDDEARARGFDGWVEAYHDWAKPVSKAAEGAE